MKFFIESSRKYNKNLEEILKNKNFNTEVNNLFLLIMNHLNDIYSDYKNVKVNVLEKNIIINTFLENIQNNVESVEIIKENIFDIKKEDLGKTGIQPIQKQDKKIKKRKINEKTKSIVVQLSPIELYSALVEIQPKYFYIKDEYVFKKILQKILEQGSILNSTEIMRDFRGYSWFSKPIEKFPYVNNVIYQNLIWLLGPEFMFQWENQNINLPDYIKELKFSLIKQFGEQHANYILDAFYGSIYAYPTKKNKEKIEKQIKKKQKILKTMEDSSKFLEIINSQKKKLSKKITNIDIMLNNDKVLVKSFKEKNKRLSKQKKLTSIRLYREMVEKERVKASNEYDFLTMLQKPKNFLEYKEELKREVRTFDKNKKIYDYIVKLELKILEAMQYKMTLETNSSKLLLTLKSLRYFKFLKLGEDLSIKDITKLNKKIKEIEKALVTKLCEIGTIQMLSFDIDINYDLISTVLDTQIVDLEDVLVEIDYKPMTLGIRIYEKDTLEKEEIIKINRKPDLNVKLRKKARLFL